jgi:hypothetical protein
MSLSVPRAADTRAIQLQAWRLWALLLELCGRRMRRAVIPSLASQCGLLAAFMFPMCLNLSCGLVCRTEVDASVQF